MPKLEIGEYLAILHNADGQETGRIMIVPRKRFPLIGEAIPLDGKCYRVRDIQHPPEENDQFDRFVYTDLVAFLVEEAQGGEGPRNGGPGEKETNDKKSPPSSPTLVSVVIPFRGSPISASSPLLTFMKLIAAAVTLGYQDQAYRLERMKFATWLLDWSGDQWVAQELGSGRTADELRELSRAAKRAASEAEAFCREILPLVPVEAEQPVADVIELAAFRRGR
jgi:hypothetical protein